jgi:hypothetical protein
MLFFSQQLQSQREQNSKSNTDSIVSYISLGITPYVSRSQNERVIEREWRGEESRVRSERDKRSTITCISRSHHSREQYEQSSGNDPVSEHENVESSSPDHPYQFVSSSYSSRSGNRLGRGSSSRSSPSRGSSSSSSGHRNTSSQQSSRSIHISVGASQNHQISISIHLFLACSGKY